MTAMRIGRSFWDLFFWVASLLVLLSLLVGLDGYRRPILLRGYGPDRRVYFTETLRRAEELETDAGYRLVPETKWHLLRGWDPELGTEGARPTALAARRRAQVVLPCFGAMGLKVRMELIPLPASIGAPGAPLIVELGANGETIAEVAIRRRKVVELEIPRNVVRRGDNILFLYRASRWAEPGPWVALGFVEVKALLPGE